ncbi:MAG: cyclopropane-fatty-acyl-phospholipid synthase family protein [Planctomycetota bacterium]
MPLFEAFFRGPLWAEVQRLRYTPESAAAIATAVRGLLALEPGHRVLDVPCGNGPIAIPLAAAGLAVSGVDLLAERLEEARLAAETAGITLDLHQGDMRELPWTSCFDAAICFWGSFGYFGEVGDEAFARAVHQTLVPGGRFLIEGPSLETIGPHYQAESCAQLGDITIEERRQLDFVTGVLDDDWTFRRGDKVELARTSIRMYSVAELSALLRRAGFREVHAHADLKGTPFTFGARLHLVALA